MAMAVAAKGVRDLNDLSSEYPELLEEILVDPKGFHYFVNECDNPTPNPDRMTGGSALQFAKFYSSASEEWKLFNSVVTEARSVFSSADFFVGGSGPAWNQIATILGSSAW